MVYMRKVLLLLSLPFFLYVTSCQLPPVIAQMEANIDITSQTQGSQNTVANVNFTERSVETIDGDTIIDFSNTDGYRIQFQLVGSSPSAGEYAMDSGNSLTGSFTLTNDGQSFVVNVMSTNTGQLNINSINIQDGELVSMSGGFEINITSGAQSEDQATGVLVGVISF